MQIPATRFSGVIQLLTGAVMISFSAVFVRVADVGPFVAGFYRMLFGGIILTAIALIRRERFWRGVQPLLLALACGFFFVMDLCFWHPSIHAVGPGLSTLLANFQVFALAGYGLVISKEAISFRLALSILLSMTGLYLIVGVDWNALTPAYKTGVWLGLGTAVWYSAYLITLRTSRLRPDALSPFANLAIISLAAAAIMSPIAAASHESFVIPNARTWTVLTAYGLLCQVAGWMLIARGMSLVETSIAGLILLLQPLLSIVWDVLFFSRPFTRWDGAGVTLALVGIYLGSTRHAAKKPG